MHNYTCVLAGSRWDVRITAAITLLSAVSECKLHGVVIRILADSDFCKTISWIISLIVLCLLCCFVVCLRCLT